MTYQPHQSEDVTMKPVAGMNIDEAALKAGISEPAAFMWQHDETGSVGFVDPWQVANGWQEANPRLKIIGPLYTHPAPVAVVPAEQAEDSAMLDWLDKNNARFQMGWRVGIAPAGNASIQSVIQLGGQPLTSIRAAIRAAMSNREAGGS